MQNKQFLDDGSSPLSRGIRQAREGSTRPIGIIPALAGNTKLLYCYECSTQDHPRSRGEYLLSCINVRCPGGSSPLSRGILHPAAHPSDRARIIPALAGNTSTSMECISSPPDHPRSRGEYACGADHQGEPEGSSPLSRGIHDISDGSERNRRIIPALAGNTPSPNSALSGTKDHPRSRGEYILIRRFDRAGEGSSPLSRGIQPDPSIIRPGDRIIPALAGNTMITIHGGSIEEDHPRSRGEYTHAKTTSASSWGSSPLSRGILVKSWSTRSRRRIIPALAGNTFWYRRETAFCRDHPRSRGEYSPAPDLTPGLNGSSPLSRGIRGPQVLQVLAVRIIPALAGNTTSHRGSG